MLKLQKGDLEKAVVLCLLAFLFFTISDALRKLLATDGYAVWDILFWQAFFGMVLLCLASPFLGGMCSLITNKSAKWHIVRGILMAVNTSLSMNAIAHIPLTDAYTLFFLTPFTISLMGTILLGEGIGIYRIMAIIVGFIGGLIAFRPGFAEWHFAYFEALGCVLVFSTATILSRQIHDGRSRISYGFWTFFFLVIAILWRNGGALPPIHDSYFLMICAAIGASYSFALIAVASAFRLAPASVIAPYQYIQFIFALSFGYLLFGNIPDFFKLLGAFIIVTSGLFFFARERKAKGIAL